MRYDPKRLKNHEKLKYHLVYKVISPSTCTWVGGNTALHICIHSIAVMKAANHNLLMHFNVKLQYIKYYVVLCYFMY